MTNKNKVLIATSSFGEFNPEPLDMLDREGYLHVMNPYGRTLKPDELLLLAKDCTGLIAGTENLSGDLLQQLHQLKVISRCGVGMDNVDLIKAKAIGIKVFNTPDAPTLAVAELTLGLIFDLLRKISLANNLLHLHKWQKQMGNLLHGKKVGIIGFGRIGRKVAQMLQGLACEVAYCDPYVENSSSDLEMKPLVDLLKWADIISIHVSKATQIIGRSEMELLKKKIWIINTSRGSVIDEDVLFNFLKDKKIAGAALDVFSEEPYQGPLCELDNVILTPHIGSYAQEARVNMETEAVKNLLKGFKEHDT